MKTKSFVFAVTMALISVVAVAADPVGPTVVVVNQKESGMFKVIYQGAQVGKVSLKIYDAANHIVFTETINGVEGFVRPINFKGMEAGVYKIEIADAAGKRTQTIEHNVEKALSAIHISKIGVDSKYLLSVANKGTSEKINVRIFDGNNNQLHNEVLTVNGDLGLVYNLKNVTGVPTFEVTNQAGVTKIIK
ncbi:MAG: hypothetical protein KBF45_09060 [Cyclobacteriaceae bacterium]|jgi:opacity protein-like surface antigen|nr:hypothetical protein [Cyclobacteriaceae bacterium]